MGMSSSAIPFFVVLAHIQYLPALIILQCYQVVYIFLELYFLEN